MNIRKSIGATMLATPFVAIAIAASLSLGHWWAGPAIILGWSVFGAFVWVAASLLIGDD